MGANLRGGITRALPSGLVWGWLIKSKPEDSISTAVEWVFELQCDNVKVAEVFIAQQNLLGSTATQSRCLFRATIPHHIISAIGDISLVARRGDEHRVLDIAAVRPALAGLDGIRNDGTVTGWVLPNENGPRILMVSIGSERIGTVLADRYHPDFPPELLDFVGFSVIVPRQFLREGLGKSLEVRDVATGNYLIGKPLKELPSLEETRAGLLPTDAVTSTNVARILSDSGVDSFVVRYGHEAFVKVSFAYVLERDASQSELKALVGELTAGQFSSADLLEGLLTSEERRRRGPFVGAFPSEGGYPFLCNGLASESATNRVLQKRRGTLKRVKKVHAALASSLDQAPHVTQSIVHQTSLSRPLYIKRCMAHLIGKLQGNVAQRILSLADSARDRRDWRSAGTLYREVLSLKPKWHEIWVQHGHSLKETGDFVAAEVSYRTALTVDSTAADTHLQLGHVLKLQGRIEEARDSYSKAIMLSSPDDTSNRFARAELANLP